MAHSQAHGGGRETSGTTSRPGRELQFPLARFDLAAELERLEREPQGNDPDRSTITLAKPDSFRVVLSALRDGATIGGDETNGALSVLVLRGELTISRGDREERLGPNELAVVEPGGPWSARAASDCAVLLTASWPPEAADQSAALSFGA